MNAYLTTYKRDGSIIAEGYVELDPRGEDLTSFGTVFPGTPHPDYAIIEMPDGSLRPCMSWREYQLGTPITGSGANSIDFASWEEFNEWLTYLNEYADCEPYVILYADDLDPFVG